MLLARALLATLAFGMLLTPLAVAQTPPRTARIGFLGNIRPQGFYLEAFRQGLREQGYVEGQNLTIEFRYPQRGYERLAELAAELVRLKVDVIVAAGSPAPLAAKAATTTIPIVMTNAGDPVGSGLVASLARPGGNVTGLSLLGPPLVGKQFELLKETVRKGSRVALLTNPGHPLRGAVLEEAQIAARSLGLALRVLDAGGPDDLDGVFSTMRAERPGGLVVMTDPMFVGQRARIAELAAKSRLPAVSGVREFADAGLLMAYGPSLPDLFRRAATYVDKILRGAKPADLPVEQPMKFELVINLKTAKALGLTIPPSVLIRADQMIQ